LRQIILLVTADGERLHRGWAASTHQPRLCRQGIKSSKSTLDPQ